VGAAKDLISSELEMIPAKDPRYAFHATSLNYGGIAQKVVVFWSQEMQVQKEKTFDKNLQKTIMILRQGSCPKDEKPGES
jgi:transposase